MKLFTDMNPKSRIWIYQSDKKFTNDVDAIKRDLKIFTDQWQAHRKQLLAACEIVYDQFIMFAVDEELSSASGCSIDSSVQIIKKLEDNYNISLLNRMLLTYRKNDSINVISRIDFAKESENGLIDENTIVFNNIIQTVEELENWEVPAYKSWHFDAFSFV